MEARTGQVFIIRNILWGGIVITNKISFTCGAKPAWTWLEASSHFSVLAVWHLSPAAGFQLIWVIFCNTYNNLQWVLKQTDHHSTCQWPSLLLLHNRETLYLRYRVMQVEINDYSRRECASGLVSVIVVTCDGWLNVFLWIKQKYTTFQLSVLTSPCGVTLSADIAKTALETWLKLASRLENNCKNPRLTLEPWSQCRLF